jgi:hypothetical protein
MTVLKYMNFMAFVWLRNVVVYVVKGKSGESFWFYVCFNVKKVVLSHWKYLWKSQRLKMGKKSIKVKTGGK